MLTSERQTGISHVRTINNLCDSDWNLEKVDYEAVRMIGDGCVSRAVACLRTSARM
jgi:hypothetical protein